MACTPVQGEEQPFCPASAGREFLLMDFLDELSPGLAAATVLLAILQSCSLLRV